MQHCWPIPIILCVPCIFNSQCQNCKRLKGFEIQPQMSESLQHISSLSNSSHICPSLFFSLLKVETNPSNKLVFTSPLGDDVTSRRSSHHQQRQQRAAKAATNIKGKQKSCRGRDVWRMGNWLAVSLHCISATDFCWNLTSFDTPIISFCFYWLPFISVFVSHGPPLASSACYWWGYMFLVWIIHDIIIIISIMILTNIMITMMILTMMIITLSGSLLSNIFGRGYRLTL